MADPIVNYGHGPLKGVTDTDLNGKTFYKFLGIPYAKPPIGPLRFKSPEPADSWTGVRDATKEGSPCLGLDILSGKIVGSEDCLYLNVFTQQIPQANIRLRPLPVMVFIHGGAFTLGSGSEQMAGPKYLLAQGVVLVTINYRLGIFGFLSSDDVSLDIPGNAGLKDQTFALKWVQDNISSFNGDPNNVTIFGVSAGGASVHFQILSPTAKGLFHKAIAQSGTALNPWAWGQKNVIQVAEQLGKNVSTDKEALDVLINIPAMELYQATQKLRDVLLDSTQRRPFGPVIEKANPTAFLTENPLDLLKSGRFNQVPTILGCTSNEGLLIEFKTELFFGQVKPKDVGAFWSLDLKNNPQKLAEIKAKLNNFYFKEGETQEAIHEIVGDVGFAIGIIEAAKLEVKMSSSPVYLYVFSYELAASKIMLKLLGADIDKYKGVSHGGDIAALFSSSLGSHFNMDSKVTEETIVAVKQVTKIWADFARTGRPHELWEPVTDVNDLKYFDIDKDSKLKVNPFAERMAVWEEVLKEASGINAHLQENATQ